MLPNNSGQQPSRVHDRTQGTSSKFDKVMNFIQWSEAEGSALCKFQQLLEKEIRISKQDLSSVLGKIKIDWQICKYLLMMSTEIDNNLSMFFKSNLQDYQASLETQALGKVNLLTRNSSQHARNICDVVCFLHFASCNMDQYNKSIQLFEARRMYERLTEWQQQYSCVLKQKIFTVISIIYIKYGITCSKSNVVESAIAEREKYCRLKAEANEVGKALKKQALVQGSTQQEPHSPSQNMKSILRKKRSYKKSVYESLTIYLRVKLIQGCMYGSNPLQQTANQFDIDKFLTGDEHAESYYKILVLISQYTKQLRNKEITSLHLKNIYESFYEKMKVYEDMCRLIINRIDEKQYITKQEVPITGNQVLKKAIFKISKKQQQPIEKSKLEGQVYQTPKRSKSELLGIKKGRSLTKDSNLKDQLHKKFFSSIEKEENDSHRGKSKSAKALQRNRSKSKIMAKILANTFENAKNALRQIQFQIKTNSHNNSIATKFTAAPKEPKLVRKRKAKVELYQQVSNSKIGEICQNKLLLQVENELESVIIWNPISKIEQNKRCVIEHRTIHKDHHQFYPDGQGAEQEMVSEFQARLKVMKYIDGAPQEVNVRIKPKDKNYILKLNYSSYDHKQVELEILLPKSNNIFTGRYKTIWPTIKYLLRKKILQHPIFRENQYIFADSRGYAEERRHLQVREEKIIGIFGPIDEDQLCEISSTLTLICKFFDLLLHSQASVVGRKYELSQISAEKQAPKQSRAMDRATKTRLQIFAPVQKNIGLMNLKLAIWLKTRGQAQIGEFIIKHRGSKLSLQNSYFQNPFYLMSVSAQLKSINSIIEGGNQIVLTLKAFSLGVTMQEYKKKTIQLFAIPEYPDEQQKQMQMKILKSTQYMQTITLSSELLQQKRIDLNEYLQVIKNIISGTKKDHLFVSKLLQACWGEFSCADDFFCPSFFIYNFTEIDEPFDFRVNSEGVLILKHSTHEYNSGAKVKMYENVSDFNVDDLTKASACLEMIEDKNHTPNKKRAATIFHNNPSPNRQKKSRTSEKNSNTCEKNKPVAKKLTVSDSIKFFVLLDMQNRGKRRQDKQIIQVKFLIPLSRNINWLVEINKTDIEKERSYKIVLSAQDLYFMGISYCESEESTLNQLKQLTKFMKVDNNSLIKKLVFQLPSKQLVNTSLQGYQKANVTEMGYEPLDSREQLQSNFYRQISKMTIYRSIYLNKKQREIQRGSKGYYQSVSSFAEHKTYNTKGSNTVFKHRLSNRTIMNKTQVKDRTSTFIGNYNAQEHRIHNFIIKMNQFEWYLSSMPLKIDLSSQKNSHLQQTNPKLFAVLSLKFVSLWQQFPRDSTMARDDGFIELEIHFSQAEYTIVGQIPIQDFFSLASKDKKTLSAVHKFINQILKRVKFSEEPPKKKQAIKQDRRFSIKTRQMSREKKDSLTLSDNMQRQHNMFLQHHNQKQNRKTSKLQTPSDEGHITKEDKSQLKKFIAAITIEKPSPEEKRQAPKQVMNQCRDCRNHQLRPSLYVLGVTNHVVLLKMRLYHEYNFTKHCIFDVYFHSDSWEIGTGVNSGVGLGAEVEITSISQLDHFQLIKISRNQNFVKKKRVPEKILGKPFDVIEVNDGSREEDSLSFLESFQTFPHNDEDSHANQDIKVDEIACVKVLELYRQYTLEHVEAISQLQPHFYTKNTVCLSELVSFFVESYTKNNRNIRKRQA